MFHSARHPVRAVVSEMLQIGRMGRPVGMNRIPLAVRGLKRKGCLPINARVPPDRPPALLSACLSILLVALVRVVFLVRFEYEGTV